MFGGSWKNCYFESHEKSMDKTYLTKQEGKRFSPMVEMTIRSCSEGHVCGLFLRMLQMSHKTPVSVTVSFSRDYRFYTTPSR